MNNTPAIVTHDPMMIRSLRITTKIRLHPDFIADHREFARRHHLAPEIDIFPVTDLRNDPNADFIHTTIEKTKASILLLRGAIRLFTMMDSEGDWVQSIELYPSLLLYGDEKHPYANGDLQQSLSILKEQVALLLADSLDSLHIVPGLAQGKDHVAVWSKVDCELLMPKIQIQCLHNLSHPLTGPAQGAKRNRIQLGDKKDDCLIRIKVAKKKIVGVDGAQSVQGARVRLILKGKALTLEFAQFGTIATREHEKFLVSFTESSIAQVHQSVMTEIQGTILPVPTEWRNQDRGKPLTTAKVLALLSQLTSIPLGELMTMDKEIRKPSVSTTKRLKKDVQIESSRLSPVPVSSLFHPDVYSAPISRGSSHPGKMDAEIARVYGMDRDVSNLLQV